MAKRKKTGPTLALLQGPDYVKHSEFTDIAQSIFTYLNTYPFGGISSRLQCEVTAVESGAGATETIIKIQFGAELTYDWYTSVGMLAKILAANSHGTFKRKVGFAIQYAALPVPHFKIGLDIQVFEVRVGKLIEGKDWAKLDPEDLDTIR